FKRHEELGTLGEIRGKGVRIETGVGSAGVPRPPSSSSVPLSESAPVEQTQQPEEGRRGTPALPTRNVKSSPVSKKEGGCVVKGHWIGAIPKEGTPEREAYLNSLADDEVPQPGPLERARREDLARRRAATEAHELEFIRSKTA